VIVGGVTARVDGGLQPGLRSGSQQFGVIAFQRLGQADANRRRQELRRGSQDKRADRFTGRFNETSEFVDLDEDDRHRRSAPTPFRHSPLDFLAQCLAVEQPGGRVGP